MEIIDYDLSKNKQYWLREINKSDWRAGKDLHELLCGHRLKELCGERTKVFLLTDQDKLLSFCTYAQQDDITEPSLTPWVGFVYTFPQFRGKRYIGKLIEYTYALAQKEGYRYLYISTGETGLYEKYGFHFWKEMMNRNGEKSRVYKRATDH